MFYPIGRRLAHIIQKHIGSGYFIKYILLNWFESESVTM